MILIAGPNTQLYKDMLRSMEAAIRPGTRKNQEVQAKHYLQFMICNKYDYRYPDLIHLLLYIQILANTHKSPISVKNYVSGAKTFVRKLGTSADLFDHYMVKDLQKGICNISAHIPDPAPRLPMKDLKNMLMLMAGLGVSVTGEFAAILCMFSTFLRQSNVMWCESSGGRHLLRREQIADDGSPTIWVMVTSTKSTTAARMTGIPVLANGGLFCPVAAWREHVARCPGHPSSPAFQTAEGYAIAPDPCLNLCRLLLAAGRSPYKDAFTFHSLRRMGALEATDRGAKEADVRDHGMWAESSPAFHSYVPRFLISNVAKKLSQSLAS